MAPSQISEYTILPLALPAQPSLQLSSPATHKLFLRPHAPKIPIETDSRSIFIVNVPVDATSTHLRAIFTSLIGSGRFESVTFEGEKRDESSSKDVAVRNEVNYKPNDSKKRKRGAEIADDSAPEKLPATWDRELHRSGSTAVVVLVDNRSVESAFKAIKKLHKASGKGNGSVSWPIWGEGIEGKVAKLGSARYAAHHSLRHPNKALLQSHVDAFMTKFNAREAEAAQMAKRARNVPDDDGFVTVTRGGRTGPARREDAENKRREMEEKEKGKREEMSDFYRFQTRERRKAEQGELVKKFEEDRRRVEEMREKRGKFRPER